MTSGVFIDGVIVHYSAKATVQIRGERMGGNNEATSRNHKNKQGTRGTKIANGFNSCASLNVAQETRSAC